MRILLMGHNKWACMTLRALLEADYEVVGVITETDEFDQREAQTYERFARYGAYESLKEVARELGLDVYQPEDINDPAFIEKIESLRPDLLVCVSYHAIIKTELLNKYKQRIINAHLAPLPYYRGRAPINWAIINGEDHTAVTVHFMNEGVDTGPIIVQERVPIYDDDRAIDVLLRALPYFPKLVLKAVRLIEEGKVEAVPQNPYEGTYFPKRTPEDGLVDWTSEKAKDIHNKIRALIDPYPGAFSYYRGDKVIFISSELPKNLKRVSPVGGIIFGKNSDQSVKVTTIDGCLVIKEIRVHEREAVAARYFKMGGKLSAKPEGAL